MIRLKIVQKRILALMYVIYDTYKDSTKTFTSFNVRNI